LIVAVVGWIAWGYVSNIIQLGPEGPAAEAALAASIAAQDEKAFYTPSRSSGEAQPVVGIPTIV